MSYRIVLAPGLAAPAAGVRIGLAVFGHLTSEAVQNPILSLDMGPTGNTYDAATNTMTVGSIENCLKATAPGNNPAQNLNVHLVIEDVEDLEGWQVRVNYLGDQFRPSS